MGTRGLLGFVIDGQLKAAYNHFDSYPGGLGLGVLEFARQVTTTGAATAHAERVRSLRVVSDETPVTAEDVEKLRQWTNGNVGGSVGDLPSWYQLLRETQGDPEAILSAGYLEDAASFAEDSLFCEWGYVLDFDRCVLEVYQGFQQQPPTEGRWAVKDPTPTAEQVKRQERLGHHYWPISRVAEFPFERLPEPEQFIAKLEPDDEK